MKSILDASVAVKWFLTEAESDRAYRLLERQYDGSLEFMSPDVFPIEVAHAITRSERRGLLAASEGRKALQVLLASLPRLHGSVSLLGRAYELSSRARIGIYDCLYVALAEREGCLLVTADDRLLRNLPSSPIVALAEVP